MLDWIKTKIANQYMQGVIRALLAAAGGWLLANGISQEKVDAFLGPAADILAAVGTIALTALWSVLSKKKSS